MSIRKQIFGHEHIFDEFIYEEKNVDLEGWNSKHPVFEYLLEKTRPNLIIEIGTWKGGSAIHMAQLSKKYNFLTEIICIDTFLGSSQMWTIKKKDYFESLKIKNGYPQVYNTFLNNIHFAKVNDIITPLPTDSFSAIKILASYKIYSNFFYVDGAHEYYAVKSDLKNLKALLRNESVIILDDFGLPGVNRAAKEMSRFLGLNLYFNKQEKGKAVLTNNVNLDF